MLCPICGFDYVRLVEVETYPAGESQQTTTINARGVSTSPHGGVGGAGRGNTLILTFHCESGHEFKKSFLFHKGQTSVESFGAKIPEGTSIKEPLWRD